MSEINKIDEIIGTAIECLVDRKTPPNVIKNNINKKFQKQFVVQDITDFIKKGPNKIWDPQERIYKEIQSSAITNAEMLATYIAGHMPDSSYPLTDSCEENPYTLESSNDDEQMVNTDTSCSSLTLDTIESVNVA